MKKQRYIKVFVGLTTNIARCTWFVHFYLIRSIVDVSKAGCLNVKSLRFGYCDLYNMLCFTLILLTSIFSSVFKHRSCR